MEEIKVTNLGSSLPVPCVQELAKEALTTVPPRYVRLDQDPPFVSDTSSLPKVPVIDMQSLTSKDLMDRELEKLHHACKHWGFFQGFVIKPKDIGMRNFQPNPTHYMC
uniref:Non-haem dioxygenase N-terminal domain-containing protein n=1 Tax=Quercus lobata TaxID=97700 RepID=A0A7N2LS88_QUELO